MITVLLFAHYRELLGCDKITVADQGLQTIAELVAHLRAKGGNWETVFSRQNLLIAKNETHCQLDAVINAGDEVAFFPPVSGG